MATYFLFGKYTQEAFQGISSKRTKESVKLIRKHGGTVRAMYVLLGDKDLVIIVDFEKLDDVMQTTVALNRMTGISFTTSPVVTVQEFDDIVDKME